MDPAAIIARLKQQVRELREEVRLLRGGGPERGPLTADELGRLERDVASWVGDPSPDAALDVTGDMLWVRACEFDRGGKGYEAGAAGAGRTDGLMGFKGRWVQKDMVLRGIKGPA